MIQESEIILFILATGVLFSILANQKRIYNLFGCCCLVMAYYVLYAGWALTILEGFFFEDILDCLEHLCYALSMIFVAMWSYKIFRKGKTNV